MQVYDATMNVDLVRRKEKKKKESQSARDAD
jgi:hypothetical protein